MATELARPPEDFEPPSAESPDPGFLGWLRALLARLSRRFRAPARFTPETPYLLRGRIPPQVKVVPFADVLDGLKSWYLYVTSLCFLYIPVAAIWAFLTRDTRRAEEREIEDWIEHGPFSKQLTPGLTERERRLFGDRVAADEQVFTLRYYAGAFPLKPGLHAADTTTLVVRAADGALDVRAIAVDEDVFTPEDGEHWERARLFALFGMSWRLVGTDHTRVHFPMDSVLALSRQLLPADHPVARLLGPHGYLQQCVDQAVLYHPHSILRGRWYLPYAAFPCDFETTGIYLSSGWAGLPEADGHYPAYRYPMSPPPPHTAYQRFLGVWWQAILEHVAALLEGIPDDDPHVLRWADALSKQLPGFPDGARIFEEDNLARAVTGYIHAMAVEHHVDHHCYGAIPPARLPNRLRVRPPRRGEPLPDAGRPLATRVDLFRHRMAWRLFFRPKVFRPFRKVRYRFDDPARQETAERFLASMPAIDDRVRAEGLKVYVPAEGMAASLQA